MKYKISTGAFLFIFIMLVLNWLSIEAQTCNPSGRIVGEQPLPGQCNQENQSDCCKRGKLYTTYKCSLQVSQRTKATLTINTIQITPLSWHCQQGGSARGRGAWTTLPSMVMEGVKAKVVDECDSTMGCDADHDYQPPCPNNIVDASKAVWKDLGVPESNWGEMEVQWSNA